MRYVAILALMLSCSVAALVAKAEEEPVLLIGTIVKWQYPGAKIGGAEASDGATVDAAGKRPVASTVMKTTMTTKDPVEEVVKFYRALLARDEKTADKLGVKPGEGQSVTFGDESAGRPFALHTILVNTARTSTVIIITRGAEEKETRITWKRYLVHEVGK